MIHIYRNRKNHHRDERLGEPSGSPADANGMIFIYVPTGQSVNGGNNR